MKRLLAIKVTDKHTASLEADGWADVVVSLLDPDDPMWPDFGNLRNIRGAFEDHEDPSFRAALTLKDVAAVLKQTSEILDSSNVIVHCFGGICRSTAVAIAIHVQSGFSPAEAIKKVEAVRPQMWPNELVIQHADKCLGCGGTLIDEVADWKSNNRGFIIL